MARIYIPIETKVREFDGKLWLALNLAKEGHKVAIGEKSRKLAADKLQPDVHLDVGTTYSDSYKEILSKISEMGCKIGVLDTEGGVFQSKDDYFNRLISEEILELVDILFAWGEVPARPIKEKTSYPAEQIYVTGNPRFDVLHPELRGIYSESAAALTDRFGEFILFNTNFSNANHFDQKKRKEILEKRNIESTVEKMEYERKLIDRFLKTIDSLSETHPRHTIVIRPHPSENHEFYRKQFADDHSIVVEHSGDVRAWIYAADCVIHNSCTTGIEAAMLNKPVIAYEPDLEAASYQRPPLPNAVSTSVRTEDELLDQVQIYISQSKPYEMSPSQISELHKYFANVEELAAPKIVEAISELDGLENEKKSPDIPLNRRLELWTKNQPIAPFIKKIQNISKKSSYSSQKFPGLTIDEVRSRIRDFEDQVGTMNLEVSRVNRYDDIYWIQQK